MESDKIKLIIKAPNQNVNDQTIDCSLNWTIEQLKIHLSEVYPNKPAPREQKIIYSGRLLRDHLRLRDILRHEDKNAAVHTLHLVCSRQTVTVSPESDVKSSHEASSSSSHSGGSQDEDDDDFRQRTQGPSDNADVASPPVSTASGVPPSALGPDTYSQMLSMSQVYANFVMQQGQSSGMWPVQSLAGSSDTAADMVAYQQLYSNYYHQYMQNMQMLSGQHNFFPVVQSNHERINHGNNAYTGAENPPADRNIQVNAQGGPVLNDNDEHGHRDWLDYFYLCCRGFVLFSIVYFYSSPERLMLVVGLAFLALLYQEGWILARARNNRQRESRANHARQRAQATENRNNTEDAPVHDQNEERNDREHQHVNEIEAIMDGDEPPHTQNQNIALNHNPAWTFITSFFSSLIPEPPAPVNIN